MTLEATKVVIIGGTSGIGLATAQAAARAGAVVVVASHSPGASQGRAGTTPRERRGSRRRRRQ